MRILIVDDSERRRKKLADHLMIHGGFGEECVLEVDCQDRAREALKREYFDVMVLDVVIPKRTGGRASAALGIDLLKLATTSPRYKCPEKIIGITAHLDDIAQFRTAFLSHCTIVVEAREDEIAWRNQVLQSLSHTTISKRSRGQVGEVTHYALTIHGIQTFGAWQRRLRILARNTLGRGQFFTYRYGVFSFIAFLIPFFRNREITRLKNDLENIFPSLDGNMLTIYSHSFGTFLAVNALKQLISDGVVVPVHTLVLAGSVLHSGTDLEFLKLANIRLVNDCADHDYILYLSQALVLGTGMAGKFGFYGSQNEFRINRFFLGGHSSYFVGDKFMQKYWLPLLNPSAPVEEVDLRMHSTIRHNFLDRIFTLVGYLKPIWYSLIIILAIYACVKFLFFGD
ncbi:hypothetical protein [Acidovorax sp. LjRoot117]|uniref:hypothetical protein n=1 Tax=Acidovorax sp. LjRoot117 TaxID=3342255 RepID=UPI003ED12005